MVPVLDSTLVVKLLTHLHVLVTYLSASFPLNLNRLGTTTSTKLVFCYRMLRGNVTTDVPDDWDIDNNGAAVSQLDMNDEATLLPQDSSASEAESE